jgi:hypothetical protein
LAREKKKKKKKKKKKIEESPNARFFSPPLPVKKEWNKIGLFSFQFSFFYFPHAPSFFESKGFAFLVLALMQQPLASLSGQFCRRILLQFTLKSISLVFRSLVAWFAVSDRR